MEVRGNNRLTFTGLFNTVGSPIRPCHWYRGRRPAADSVASLPAASTHAKWRIGYGWSWYVLNPQVSPLG